jgi:hypothetical protein
LKNWIAQQAEREQEAAERKRRKLERLREEPKHNFRDQTYEKERSQLTEHVTDAVEKGTSLGETILYTEIDIMIMIHAAEPSELGSYSCIVFLRVKQQDTKAKLE